MAARPSRGNALDGQARPVGSGEGDAAGLAALVGLEVASGRAADGDADDDGGAHAVALAGSGTAEAAALATGTGVATPLAPLVGIADGLALAVATGSEVTQDGPVGEGAGVADAGAALGLAVATGEADADADAAAGFFATWTAPVPAMAAAEHPASSATPAAAPAAHPAVTRDLSVVTFIRSSS